MLGFAAPPPLTGRARSTRSLHRPFTPLCTQAPPTKPKSRPNVSAPTATTYNDGRLALATIALFRRAMRPYVGWTSPRAGYSGFVEECRMLMARVGPAEQQRVVRKTLDMLFVAPYGSTAFKTAFAHPQLNARITPAVFQWLVGPCETNRPPEGGWGVKIDKCRFLDESGCKGLCVNMCQQPTQNYFTDVLGLPVRMTPDYEDKSCQMTFGVAPLPLEDDPAISGECFVDCKMSGSVKQRDATCYVTGQPNKNKR